MHKSNGAKKVQRQMAQVREELTEDVQDLRARVENLKDWRTIVRKHPWAVLASAAAVGFLLVPKRPRIVYADAETLAKVAMQQPLKVEATEHKRPGLLGGLLRSAGSTVFTGLMSVAGRQLGMIANQTVSRRMGATAPTHHRQQSPDYPSDPNSQDFDGRQAL